MNGANWGEKTTYIFPYYILQTSQFKSKFIQLQRGRPISNFGVSTKVSIKGTCTNISAQVISISKSPIVQPTTTYQIATSFSINIVITL